MIQASLYDNTFIVWVYRIDAATKARALEMEEAERRAKADGYHVRSDDGDGFFTYVQFDTLAEAVAFKLTYL